MKRGREKGRKEEVTYRKETPKVETVRGGSAPPVLIVHTCSQTPVCRGWTVVVKSTC